MRYTFTAAALFCLSAHAFAGTALPPPNSVPTLTEWGMISLGAAIVSAGLYLINKHRK